MLQSQLEEGKSSRGEEDHPLELEEKYLEILKTDYPVNKNKVIQISR